MNILKKTSLSQALFFASGLTIVSFMTLLPEKQWWHWFLIFAILMIVIASAKEVFGQSENEYLPYSLVVNQALDSISKEHKAMRQTILQQIDVAKTFMQRYTANGYSDGHSLQLVDTQTVILCTITLESSTNFDPITEERRSYDMERTYCITRNASCPIRTISDAIIIYSVDGATHIETWVPIDSKEWMYAEEHIASTLELDELLGYLRCISGVQ